MKVYLAAPIVGLSEEVKKKIELVKFTMTQNHIDVYDPSENGVPNAWGMSQDEWARAIFALDVRAIDKCDWLVCCDFGRSKPTGGASRGASGTAWECGYAFGIKKKVLIIHMDEENDYSVMLRGGSTNYCTYTDFIGMENIEEEFFVERGRVATKDMVFN